MTGAAAAPLAAQAGSWHSASDLLTPRRLLAAAKHHNKIYTFGGCGSPCFAPPLHTSDFEERLVEVYDPLLDPRLDPSLPPQTRPWSRRGAMPSIVFGAAAAAPGDGFIYLLGGFLTGASTQAYDPRYDRWTAKAPMPTPRHGLAAVAWDGKVYVVGGSNGTNALAALEVYDPANGGSWKQLPPMPTARVFLAAVVVDGKIYAIGGAPDCCGNGTTNVVEVYDINRRTWRQGPRLRLAMQTSAAAAIDGKIYVLGGFVPGQGAKGDTFALDANDIAAGWVAQTPMPVPRDQAPAVALEDGIHVLGGSTSCHCSPRGDQPTFVPSRVDLEITKTGGPTDVCPGETVSYTIKVANVGTEPVIGARVDDPAEGGDGRFSEVLPDATWTCEPSGSPGSACRAPDSGAGPIHSVVDLPVGGKVTYTLTGAVALSASGSIANSARVSPPTGVTDENSTNDRSMVVESVIHRDRLAIRKTRVGAAGPVAPGDVLLYEVEVCNRCRIPLSTRVDDALSAAGLTATGWCRHAGCPPPPIGDLHDIAVVPAQGCLTYMAAGTVPCDCGPTVGLINNVATAEAPGQRSVSATHDTPVSPSDHRLAVAVTGPDTLTLPSCGGDYTIIVSNPNPCPARGVVLEVSVPPELSLVSLSAPCTGIGPCALGDLGPAPASVRVIARIDAAAGVQCTAAPAPIIQATASNLCAPPPAPAARAAKAATIPCDLAIAKTSDVPDPAPGDCILYSIDVANHGCGKVTRARVTDAFPAALATTKWCLGAHCLPTKNGDLDDKLDLPRGHGETYRVDATISPDFSGTLDNSASVAMPAGVVDVHPEDNTATSSINVEPRPGIDAQCSGTKKFVTEGSDVVLTFVLWNGGPLTQGDNPGDEFVYVAPAGLTLVSAVASSGSITILPANTVHWNGAIPVDDMVTIDVTVNVDAGTAGMAFCNPATVIFDSNGDGINDSIVPTDDRCHPCCFTVTELGPIPTLSQLGLAVLALLAAAIGVARLRRRSPASPDA